MERGKVGGIVFCLLPANDLVHEPWDFISPLVRHELVRPGKCVEIKQKGGVRLFVACHGVIITASGPPAIIENVMLADCGTCGGDPALWICFYAHCLEWQLDPLKRGDSEYPQRCSRRTAPDTPAARGFEAAKHVYLVAGPVRGRFNGSTKGEPRSRHGTGAQGMSEPLGLICAVDMDLGERFLSRVVRVQSCTKTQNWPA